MKELIKKAQALKTAREIGCSGAHKDKNGNWMPCSSHEELIRISELAETSKWRTVVPGESKKALRKIGKNKRKRFQDEWAEIKKQNQGEWEELREKPISGIESLPGGGLVSGDLFAGKSANGPCWPGYKQVGMKIGKRGKLVPNCVPVDNKSAKGPEYVRDNDPDVFIDAESARARARQIGCIGISRRISKTGRSVWMPCTNMTDYANRTGSTPLGKLNIEKRRNDETSRAVRTILAARDKVRLKRKVSLFQQLKSK
jgi:hypothetical protein